MIIKPIYILYALLAGLPAACALRGPAVEEPPTEQQAGRVRQVLEWEGIRQSRSGPADTRFTNTGRRLYVAGDVDGGFRPRSNLYDLHTYGGPSPEDPLAGKLQGVWAQPVRGLAGYGYTLSTAEGSWKLADAHTFTQTFAAVRFDYRRGSLSATRTDFALLDLPILFSTLTLRNQGSRPLQGRLAFQATFDLQDAWFTSLAARRNVGEKLTVEDRRLVARAAAAPEVWAAAAAGEQRPDEAHVQASSTGSPGGELRYNVRLEAGEERSWTFAMALESEGGASAALDNLARWMPHKDRLLAEKEEAYRRLRADGPRLRTPDASLDAAFALAQANLQMLEAESPELGRYFYGGLEMFPFWFGNDGAYSLPGLMMSKLTQPALNHLRIGQRFQEEGCIPHQISPAGKTAFHGAAQETAQWATAVWQAYRWSGETGFLAEMYPAVLSGLFDYTLGKIDPDGDGYPEGPGMVETNGMGLEKLDSAAYTWAALNALEQMARVVGDEANAERARETAERIAGRFEQDWWDEAEGTYAMSLGEENQRIAAYHWAVLTPLEVGLASPEHARRSLATVRRQYLTEWGVKHTTGKDPRVWTLPTAVLSRAAYRYGEAQLGYEMLRRLSQTLEHGSIGMFHELIPEGLCFLQLWSAATFIQGCIEDLMGVQVDAAAHELWVAPVLPASWEQATLEALSFGGHTVDVTARPGGCTVQHRSGPAALKVHCRLPGSEEKSFRLQAGEKKDC